MEEISERFVQAVRERETETRSRGLKPKNMIVGNLG